MYRLLKLIPGLRIFDRYLWSQVSSSTFIGVVVLTGVMVLANVFRKWSGSWGIHLRCRS